MDEVGVRVQASRTVTGVRRPSWTSSPSARWSISGTHASCSTSSTTSFPGPAGGTSGRHAGGKGGQGSGVRGQGPLGQHEGPNEGMQLCREVRGHKSESVRPTGRTSGRLAGWQGKNQGSEVKVPMASRKSLRNACRWACTGTSGMRVSLMGSVVTWWVVR